jgi:hypothetical protein
LIWAGSAVHTNNRRRSMAFKQLAPLLALSGIELVSLQKDLGAGDGEALRQYPHVLRLGEEIQDFADTAAIVSLLDAVISVDTSMVHLAGALGRPVWALLPFAPDFRWMLDRDDSPWYPTVRLFRQQKLDDWEGVLDRVRKELEHLTASP